jgi:hypothetical protein
VNGLAGTTVHSFGERGGAAGWPDTVAPSIVPLWWSVNLSNSQPSMIAVGLELLDLVPFVRLLKTD